MMMILILSVVNRICRLSAITKTPWKHFCFAYIQTCLFNDNSVRAYIFYFFAKKNAIFGYMRSHFSCASINPQCAQHQLLAATTTKNAAHTIFISCYQSFISNMISISFTHSTQ